MKKYTILSLFFSLHLVLATAQTQDAAKLHETGKAFIRQGDYTNAVMVLGKAIQQEPGNFEMAKDLAFANYLKRDYAAAMVLAKPLTERVDADVQSIQILAMIYRSLEEKKELEKLYKTALKKFPSSGVLYNDLGELFWERKEYNEAIQQWEKGIQADPNHSSNYYNAAKYYYLSQEKFWGLLYGELFINLESYSDRTVEMQKMLLDGYKKLYTAADIFKDQNSKNEFERTCLTLLQKHRGMVQKGITAETIMALHTRFMLDWNQQMGGKFAFRLFDHYNQLMRAGLFEAYHQWLWGAPADLAQYQVWTQTHQDANFEWLRLQQNRVFKIPIGQYYK